MPIRILFRIFGGSVLLLTIIVFRPWEKMAGQGHWWQGYGWADLPGILGCLLGAAAVTLISYALLVRSRESLSNDPKLAGVSNVLFGALAFGAVAALAGFIFSIVGYGFRSGARIWGMATLEHDITNPFNGERTSLLSPAPAWTW